MGSASSWLRRLGLSLALSAALSGPAAALSAAAGPLVWPAGRGLVDQTGAPVSEARFAGRLRLVYFGYTRCPDLCPTALMTVTQALDDLPPALLSQLVPVMVAADPEHDGPAVLARYLDTFHPAIVAVTGPVATIDGLAAAYAAPIRRHDGTVDHPSDLFLVGPAGDLLGRLPYTVAPEALAAALRAALAR
ncbi:hypothetical protein VQ02_00570 [Methylobacterium variabile]|jgi:protein SCO1/2|uniref:Electron transporter SenC n=1 Tax=Methylobacterium variabile TaxID=298794 RepID=A0A0J6TBT7_9HYPH|nr:SCO family protein [Methylobacterium variabile]KMO43327.1 hypothetical protein VQ02_00570 [Methylobacterium variabile]